MRSLKESILKSNNSDLMASPTLGKVIEKIFFECFGDAIKKDTRSYFRFRGNDNVFYETNFKGDWDKAKAEFDKLFNEFVKKLKSVLKGISVQSHTDNDRIKSTLLQLERFPSTWSDNWFRISLESGPSSHSITIVGPGDKQGDFVRMIGK